MEKQLLYPERLLKEHLTDAFKMTKGIRKSKHSYINIKTGIQSAAPYKEICCASILEIWHLG